MTKRFRTLPVRDNQELRVDREAGVAGVIYGVSAIQAVEALGHGILADATTLKQVEEYGNAAKNGVKSRYTHPGMSSDGLGKLLGRLRNFRTEGDKTVADLHFAKSSRKTPDGDLGDYVMTLAEEDPAALGMSIVFDMQQVWVTTDGEEVPVSDDEEDNDQQYTTTMPLARVKALMACDVVDEPAANRDGLFSSALWASNQDAEQAFGQLDEVLNEWGVSPTKAYEVAIKYFDARGVKVNPKGSEMAKEETKATQPETAPDKAVELQAQVDELLAQLAARDAEAEAVASELAAKAEAETELSARLRKVEEALDASNKRNAELATEARRKRFGELAEDWTGETAKHVALLEQLADSAGEDSEAFGFYVQTQNAVAEQLNASQLFEDIGSDKPASEPKGFDAVVRERMAADKVSYSVAAKRVTDEQPELYDEYVLSKRGK